MDENNNEINNKITEQEGLMITKSYIPPTPIIISNDEFPPYKQPEGILCLDPRRQMYFYKDGFLTCVCENGQKGYFARDFVKEGSYQYAFFGTHKYISDKRTAYI